jgi:hypothetical protein
MSALADIDEAVCPGESDSQPRTQARIWRDSRREGHLVLRKETKQLGNDSVVRGCVGRLHRWRWRSATYLRRFGAKAVLVGDARTGTRQSAAHLVS